MPQSHYRYTLALAHADDGEAFDVVGFELVEGLSQPFRLTLDLVSAYSAHTPAKLLDSTATLTFWDNHQAVRYVNGVVTAFHLSDTGFARTRYQMVVEPALVRADLQADCRIFQNQNTADIWKTLLQKNKVANVDISLSQSLPTREYCVQFRETDLGFLRRLAAEDGLFYYFEHTADKHVLRLSDNSTLASNLGELTYNPTPAGNRDFSALTHWDYAQSLRTGRMTYRDYLFTSPTYSYQQQASVSQANLFGETPVADYYRAYL